MAVPAAVSRLTGANRTVLKPRLGGRASLRDLTCALSGANQMCHLGRPPSSERAPSVCLPGGGILNDIAQLNCNGASPSPLVPTNIGGDFLIRIVSMAQALEEWPNPCGYFPQSAEISWQIALRLLTAPSSWLDLDRVSRSPLSAILFQ